MYDEPDTLPEEGMEEDQASLIRQQADLLAQKITRKLDDRAAKRAYKESQWIESLRLSLGNLATNHGTYTDMFNYQTGDSKRRPEVNIVRPKVAIAISQLEKMQFGDGSDKNWAIRPATIELEMPSQQRTLLAQDGMTPATDPNTGQPLSPQDIVMQSAEAARMASMAMEQEIADHLTLSDYGTISRKAMDDLVRIGTGIIKGPLIMGSPKRKWRQILDSENRPVWVRENVDERVPYVCYVDPWYFFPDDTCNDPAKMRDSLEVHPKTDREMLKFIYNSKFFPDVVREILQSPPSRSSILPKFYERAALTGQSTSYDNKYVVIEYQGPISGDILRGFNIEPLFENSMDAYYGEVWVCENRIIGLALNQLDGCETLPYKINVWEKDPGSVFGFGIPYLMRDASRVVNETYKMILDNAGLSAMPQIVINKSVVVPEDGVWEITSGKIWSTTEYDMNVSNFMTTFDIPNHQEQLANVLQLAQGFAEEESCIPLIQAGLESPQVGSTATGTAMLMQASTSVLLNKAKQWDDNIVKPLIRDMYEWEMMYNPKNEIKGNFEIDVYSSTSYNNKLSERQDLEFLLTQVGQNPLIAERIDPDQLVHVYLRALNISGRDIIKSRDRVEAERQARAEQEQQNPPPDVLKARADMLAAEARMAQIELDRERLEFEKAEAQARAEMEYVANLENANARNQENLLQYEKALIERDTEMVKLAVNKDISFAQIAGSVEKESKAAESDKIRLMLDQMNKATQLKQKDRDLDIRERQLELAAAAKSTTKKSGSKD